MDRPDLNRLLDRAASGDTTAALGRVRARHQRRRAARLRAVALSSVVLVGLGLGLGLGLNPAGSSHSRLAERSAGTAGQMTFHRGAASALLPGAFASANSAASAPTATGTKSGLCSVLGCQVGIGPRLPLGKSRVGDLEVAAYLSSRPPVRSGVLQPLGKEVGQPGGCGPKRYVTVVVTRKGAVAALVLVPLAPQRGGDALAEVSESLARPRGSSHHLVIATAEVSRTVHSVRVVLPGGQVLRGTPHHGVVVLAGVVSPGSSNPGISVRALSRSGRILESVVVPGPSRIGLPQASCMQPTG